ncbi:MAG: hypothetical protein KBG15_21660 [Kofleriaceae bacterium]|nr:hypothetical protein [Kofleriaceae bacterium]
MALWSKLVSLFRGVAAAPSAAVTPLAVPISDDTAPIVAMPSDAAATPIMPGASPPIEITFPPILGATTRHPDGRIANALPTSDVWIQGLPCRAGKAVWFHRNGRLASVELACAHTIEGDSLRADTLVSFRPNGKLQMWQAVLDVDTNFRIRAADADAIGATIAIPAGSTVLVEDAQLRSAELVAPLTIDGMVFPAQTSLTFGDSGALSHATCGNDVTLRGIVWAAHETVIFEFGKLREGYPATSGSYDGVPYEAGEIVRLNDAGGLVRCLLAEDVRLSDVPCSAGTRIYRDDHGSLVEGTLACDALMAGVPVAAGSIVGLSDGKPTVLTATTDCELDGILCAGGNLIELTIDGKLVRATLARACVVSGWQLPTKTVVVFDHGRLQRFVGTDVVTPDGRQFAGMWCIDLDEYGQQRRALPTNSVVFGDAIALRERTTIAGFDAAARTAVVFYPNGSVCSLVLAADQLVGSWLAKAATRVHFHDNGTPSNMTLAQPTRIGDVPCAGAEKLGSVINDVEHRYREEVRFSANGTLIFATLAESATVCDTPLAPGETVAFHANGTLHIAILAKDWRHANGWVAKSGSLLGLFDDGSPSLLTLAGPINMNGTAYPEGTTLQFSAPAVFAGAIASEAVADLGACDPVVNTTPS